MRGPVVQRTTMHLAGRSFARLLSGLTLAGMLWAHHAHGETAACPNRYFPLQDGRKLTYRAGGGREFTLSIKNVQPDGDGQKALLHVDSNGRSGETEVRCTKDGISLQAGGLEGLALQSSGLEMKILSSDGVLIPTEDTLRAKKPWTNHVSVELRPPENAKMPGGIRPVIHTQFAREGVVTGEESVKTEAGTYSALTVKTTTTASSGATGSDRSVQSTLWLAPEVGIVKVATAGSTDLELIKVEAPERAELTPKPVKAAAKKR